MSTSQPVVSLSSSSTVATAPNLNIGSANPPGGQITLNPMVNTYITTTNSITAGSPYGSNIYITAPPPPAPRKPRKPREKRQVPLYTAGLEAKLNNALEKDPSKIIKYLARKTQQPPVIERGPDEDSYEFSSMFSYATTSGFAWNNNPSAPMHVIQHTVQFYAKLILKPDGTLRDFEIRIRGSKK